MSVLSKKKEGLSDARGTPELGKPASDFNMAREQGVCMHMSVCS